MAYRTTQRSQDTDAQIVAFLIDGGDRLTRLEFDDGPWLEQDYDRVAGLAVARSKRT